MGTSAKDFFSEQDQDDLRQAIMMAELDTSGEIRVHIENSCTGNVMDRAAFIFKQLEMHQTKLRNGVLIYLAIKNKRFAIIGDSGIHQIVKEEFWDDVKQKMHLHFREGKYMDGLCHAIHAVGEKLKTHFPYQRNDINELPDEVSFGKD